jgi:hypothetical protein
MHEQKLVGDVAAMRSVLETSPREWTGPAKRFQIAGRRDSLDDGITVRHLAHDPVALASNVGVLSARTVIHMLSNPIYAGKVVFKDNTCPGLHQSLVEDETSRPRTIQALRSRPRSRPSWGRLVVAGIFSVPGTREVPLKLPGGRGPPTVVPRDRGGWDSQL